VSDLTTTISLVQTRSRVSRDLTTSPLQQVFYATRNVRVYVFNVLFGLGTGIGPPTAPTRTTKSVTTGVHR